MDKASRPQEVFFFVINLQYLYLTSYDFPRQAGKESLGGKPEARWLTSRWSRVRIPPLSEKRKSREYRAPLLF
jgi:hypothetical protein